MSDVVVGFVGLGMQGAPMARRILAAGYPMVFHARWPEVVEEFTSLGGTAVASSAEVGAAADVVGVCVLDDAQVREVVSGPEGLLSTMTAGVVLVHTTATPATCIELAARAAARGVVLADAAVSGGPYVAEAGARVVMFGGDASTFAEVEPILATFGSTVRRLGPVGSGQVAKLVNNLVFTAHLGVAGEAFRIARGLGLDGAALADTLVHGSGGSRALEIVAGVGSVEALGDAAGELLAKDVRYVVETTSASGVDLGALGEVVAASLTRLGVPTDRIEAEQS